jgi:ParB family chromosome partitioning protein
MSTFQEIELSKIRPSPFNRRRRFEGSEFDDLAASIRDKGVLQPILVRPVSGDNGVTHEIVCGERRFRASSAAERQDIPCIVRDMDDDTAFEILMIENLQRQDLTELEEAEGFKEWLDRHGADQVDVLAEKIRCAPSYIRRKVSILALPKWVLRDWDHGKLKFGHIEILARMDNAKQIKEWVEKIYNWRMTVKDFRRQLAEAALSLSKAPFDLESAGCAACGKNTEVQRELFAVDTEGADCLDPVCFKRHVNNHLQKTKARRLGRWGTSNFMFEDDLRKKDLYPWDRDFEQKGHKKAPEQCRQCEECVTMVDVFGQATTPKILCIGDMACFQKTAKPRSGKQAGGNGGEGYASAAPRRQEQRAFAFREQFIKEEIPRRIKPDDELSRKLALVALVESSWAARAAFLKSHDTEVDAKQEILKMDAALVIENLQRLAVETLPSLGHDVLLMAAAQAGIDLKTDFVITDEYLNKMVKQELIEKGQELGLWETGEVRSFMHEVLGKKAGASPGGLKKSELIRCFLESGVDLKGKVPAEIYEIENRDTSRSNDMGAECRI